MIASAIPATFFTMLSATIVRHGSESHLVRPDCVYRTGCLTAVGPGYQPVSDAMAVAANFTRLWGPSGTGLAGGGLGSVLDVVRSVAAAQRSGAVRGGLGSLIANVAATMRAGKIVRDHRRRNEVVAVKRAGAVSAVQTATTLAPQYGPSTPHNEGAIRAQNGYAPAFIRPSDVGLQITASSGEAATHPATRPALVAAAQLSPVDATAPQSFVQALVTNRVPGFVGQRAGAALLRPFIGKRNGSW